MAEPTLSSGVVQAVVRTAELAGVSRAELLRAVGISAEQLDQREARLPRSIVYRICEAAMALSGDPALGLHWAERPDAYRFELLGDLMSRAATLGDGLRTLMHYLRLIQDEPSIEITEYADRVRVRSCPAGASATARRFVAEVTVSRFWRIVREYGADVHSAHASFEHAPPSYRAEYARIFRGAERFCQPFSGVVFERRLMDVAAPQRDSDVHKLLRSVADRRLSKIADNVPYAARARDVLVKRGAGRAGMDAIARSLGLSARTLRRRLDAEGIRYEEVVNEALAIRAKHLLSSPHLSIQEVANTLGFAHSSGFHRAFKRLTGMTPLMYRRQVATEVRADDRS